jgi:hypothetical protein
MNGFFLREEVATVMDLADDWVVTDSGGGLGLLHLCVGVVLLSQDAPRIQSRLRRRQEERHRRQGLLGAPSLLPHRRTYLQRLVHVRVRREAHSKQANRPLFLKNKNHSRSLLQTDSSERGRSINPDCPGSKLVAQTSPLSQVALTIMLMNLDSIPV